MTDGKRIDPFLKRELDALLTENQELHVERRRLHELRFLLRSVARVLRRKVRRRLSRKPRASGDDAGASFASSFRPYQVRQVHSASADRPRVLHVIGNFYTGGSPRLVVDLIEHLGDAFEHVTIVRDTPPQPHYVGLELHAAPSLDRRSASSLLQRLRPDLLHVHFLGHHRHPYSQRDWDWYHAVFGAAAERGCPVIENVNIPVAPYFSDAVRCYVFVSDYVRRIFGRDRDRNITIYPGSDFDLFSRRADESPPRDCVGMVYRLEKDKLDETAIDVFVEVLRRRPGARALIVGGGRFLETFRTRVADAGLANSVAFTAYVAYEDLPGFYEQLSVFVAPPHSESFGHVVPLAMNMGIPVAAYEVGALPEILGNEDVLAPAGDVEALATKVVDLLEDPSRSARIGEENRERAQRLFSVEKMAADYRALYEELVN